MKRYLIALALILMGCTHPQVKELQDWSVQEKAKAERGEIKFSDYYKEAYARIEKLPRMAGKAENMEQMNTLIQAANLYESGALTRDEFDKFRRNIQIQQEQAAQAHSAATSRAMGQAMQNFGNTVYGPEATRARQVPVNPVPAYQPPSEIRCSTYGNQTNCTQY